MTSKVDVVRLTCKLNVHMAVSYTHLDVYKRQITVWSYRFYLTELTVNFFTSTVSAGDDPVKTAG